MKLISTLDHSVNFVSETSVGYFESRYVHRPDKDYFIVYLSSQSGCSRACRMCHLTATKQTKHVDATIQDFLAQSSKVLRHADVLDAAARLPGESTDLRPINRPRGVHFNFMARGEPFECVTVLTEGPGLLLALEEQAVVRGLEPEFLISTIMPKSFAAEEIGRVFNSKISKQPEIYYSIYSTDLAFRHKWLPQAMAPRLAVEKLARWQQETGKKPRIHYAFIKGENDSQEDVYNVCRLLVEYSLEVDVNIVRYNPPDDRSQEADEEVIVRNAELFRRYLPGAVVRVIPRVGFDVAASCGMFVAPNRDPMNQGSGRHEQQDVPV